MAYSESDAWIDQVRQAVDIVEVIGRTVALRKKGRHFWGLCPFHLEKTPSFSVDPEQQLFYCFGCHVGGTVFSFLTRQTGKPFRDVLEEMAEEAGIALARSPQQDALTQKRRRIQTILEWTQRFFVQEFERHAEMIADVLAARQISDVARRRFGIGYAPKGWEGLTQFLLHQHITVEEMEAAGVVVRRQEGRGVYDRWRHRVMFPIFDARGQVVGFGGRAIDPEQTPKYLNSPDTTVFQKGKLLFGQHLAQSSWRAGVRPLLVEGYFDVVACHEAGIPQAVATLGTALSEQQARILARYHSTVDCYYDQDAAGRQATGRAFMVLSRAGLRVNVVPNTTAKDPDEYRREAGDAALGDLVSKAHPFLEGAIEALKGALTPRQKADAFAQIRPYLEVLTDPVERAGFVELAARTLHMDQSILAQTLDASQEKKNTSGKIRHNMKGPNRGSALPALEVRLLAALFRYPQMMGEVMGTLPAELSNEALRTIVRTWQPGPAAAWMDKLETEVQTLAAQALAWEEPDGGKEVVNDYVSALLQRQHRARWRDLQERIRRGEQAADVLNEIRELASHMQPYKARREG